MADANKTAPAAPAPTGKTLWTNSGGLSAYDSLEPPANLPELVKQVADEAQEAFDERVKPYRTPVTPETLRAPVE